MNQRGGSGSSSRCRAASIRRRPRRCWSRPATRSSASTLRLYDASGTAASIGGRCCGPRDIEDARATAAHLGIPALRDRRDRRLPARGDRRLRRRATAPGARPTRACAATRRSSSGRCCAFADAVGADGAGDRPLRAPRGRRADGGVALGARARPRQGPVVLPVRRPARGPGARLVSARRHDARTRCARWRAAPACPTPTSPTRSEICFIPDGDHVAFVERARRRRARRARSSTTRPARRSASHDGTHALHDRPAPRRPRRRGRAALRAAHRRRRPARCAVGPRDASGPRSRCASPTCAGCDPRAAGAGRCAARCRSATTPPPLPAWIEPGRGRRRAGPPRRAGLRRRARAGRRLLRRRRARPGRRLDQRRSLGLVADAPTPRSGRSVAH